MNSKKIKLKKHIEINNYWLHRFDWLEKDIPTCCVCGSEHGLEMCHLIPNKLGGENKKENLVLLCNRHHKEAPNISVNKEFMLTWIERENQKYELISNHKIVDLKEMTKYSEKIYSRIGRPLDNTQEILKFITYKFKEETIFPPSHHIANEETLLEYMKYLSEYPYLEIEFSQFIGTGKMIFNFTIAKDGQVELVL